ncbi:MAG TPA: C1 family peptidase [Ohtaekwangia sp.]|uniref:C1 family peptidase n=1 Tax=Ohtaekwangia sp. TaxID=2066019 RepID=UPI002F94E12E
MKKIVSIGLLLASGIFPLLAQPSSEKATLSVISKAEYTPVKNQAATGTCWSFSTTSLVESQTIKNGLGEVDLSEMFTVRNIYTEKAKNYILRQGTAQFGPGGLGHDVIRAMATYGAVPESIYSGLPLGQKTHDHNKMDAQLKTYLDSLLKIRPIPADWMKGFQSILDDHLGKAPETFTYNEKPYTPKTFATEVLHFKPEDYVNITSFSHHPFYTSFILEAPDNFANGSYYNLPLDEMIKLTEHAVERGYSIMWDADVSNGCFKQNDGYALLWKGGKAPATISPEDEELKYDQQLRQSLYENLTTQDDHLMHLVGLEKSASGKKFFLVKNSWGDRGPFKGFIHVSQAYFAINTVSLVVPKAAIEKSLLTKLGIQ